MEVEYKYCVKCDQQTKQLIIESQGCNIKEANKVLVYKQRKYCFRCYLTHETLVYLCDEIFPSEKSIS